MNGGVDVQINIGYASVAQANQFGLENMDNAEGQEKKKVRCWSTNAAGAAHVPREHMKRFEGPQLK